MALVMDVSWLYQRRDSTSCSAHSTSWLWRGGVLRIRMGSLIHFRDRHEAPASIQGFGITGKMLSVEPSRV